jgi:hypothetical protein
MGSLPIKKYDRNRLRCRFGDEHGRCTHCDDHSDMPLDQINGERRQLFDIAASPTVLERHVAAFNKAPLRQTLLEGRDDMWHRFGRLA